MESHKNLPKVSFLIPTLNAAPILQRCLKTIRTQNYPTNKIEIIVSDGGSTDNTITIAKKYNAKVIKNPFVLHEPGKTLAAKKATGEILIYTDSDNILSHKNWINEMVKPYLDNTSVMGFLPQTIPAPDTNSLDKYLGYLCTDPFTWFIYEGITSGRDFPKKYHPTKVSTNYISYRFPSIDPPLFGFSQGAGTNKKFKRGSQGHSDDLLSGIKMIKEKGLIAYIPTAGVYHYHVSGFRNYLRKYSWRVRNNLTQKVKGMGIVNRTRYFSRSRRTRMYLFIPYALSVILPMLDALLLAKKYKTFIMFWHLPASVSLAYCILFETLRWKFSKQITIGEYE